MSSADLWEDNYPHGTPEGYDGGCKGGACPAGVAYGLSCKTAKSKSNGDVQYRRLVKAGNSVPEIADALGLIGSDPSSAPAAKAPAKKPTPKTVRESGMSMSDAAAALQRAAQVTAVRPEDVGIVDTAEPKHGTPAEATTAIVADEKREARVAALKAHATTKSEQPTPTPAAAKEPTPTPTPAPAPAPKAGEIRAWAKAKGYDVGSTGKLPKYIVDDYWEKTGRLTPAPSPSFEAVAEPVEICLICKKTGAANFECEHPDAHTPNASATHDANGEPTGDTEPEDTDVTVVITAEIPDEPEATTEERPDWGTIAARVDLEAARRWAVRFEQEYAHIEEKLAATETACEELSAQADKLLADVEREQAEALRLAREYVDEFGKNLTHQAHIEDLRERLATEQQLRGIAERAAALALTKWGEERAANEASHALIVGQAHTINTLTDCLAAPRWVTGVDVDPAAFDVSASRMMHVPERSHSPSSVDIPDGTTGDNPPSADHVAQATAVVEEEVVLGFDGAQDSDTVAIAKKPRPWHRR
jgi:hypothetical protein